MRNLGKDFNSFRDQVRFTGNLNKMQQIFQQVYFDNEDDEPLMVMKRLIVVIESEDAIMCEFQNLTERTGRYCSVNKIILRNL